MTVGIRGLSDTSGEDLEVAMKRASLVVSLAALALMVGGLCWHLAAQRLREWPGDTVMPLTGLFHPRTTDPAILAVSAGVLLLGLLPAMRVVLALGIYAGRRRWADVVLAIIVVLELAASLIGIGQ